MKHVNAVTPPNSKLVAKDILKIRKWSKSGKMTGVELAKKFNVTQTTISLIVNKKTWKHV